MKNRILVVDDDPTTDNAVKALEEAGCKVKAVATGEKKISLTKMEFGMLLLFVQKAGRVLSRGFLRKLGDMGKELETIKGVGYLLPRE